jgi:hypothetical protein
MGQTVNLLVIPSVVRIHHSPQKTTKAGVAQLVERQPSKLNVAGSNLVRRSQKVDLLGLFIDDSLMHKPKRRSQPLTIINLQQACCSSGVEHFLGKEEVVSSNLINSSKQVVIK